MSEEVGLNAVEMALALELALAAAARRAEASGALAARPQRAPMAEQRRGSLLEARADERSRRAKQ